MKIKDVHETVKRMLEADERLRDNDDLLYCEMAFRLGLDSKTFGTVFHNRAELGLPPYETVRRARQKVQAENPELRGKRVREREEAEEAFRAYAIS